MNERDQYLFRALRQAEIEAAHCLIPKEQGPFEAHPRLAIDTRLPFRLGPTKEGINGTVLLKSRCDIDAI